MSEKKAVTPKPKESKPVDNLTQLMDWQKKASLASRKKKS